MFSLHLFQILFSSPLLTAVTYRSWTECTFCIMAKKKRNCIVCFHCNISWAPFHSLLKSSSWYDWRNTSLWYKLKIFLIIAKEGLRASAFRSWTLSDMPSDEYELGTFNLLPPVSDSGGLRMQLKQTALMLLWGISQWPFATDHFSCITSG